MSDSRRKMIIDTVSDLVSELMFYGRKEDEDLPSGSIEEAIAAGEISVAEIIAAFGDAMKEALD